MSKPFSHLLQHRLKQKQGDSQQLAADLAPLEEQKSPPGAIQEPGAIIVGNQNLSLSKDIMEVKTGGQFLGMEPVVLFIIGFMLAFILFIAWQISRMPG